MTREDFARQALDSMEKTCALLRTFLEQPEPAAPSADSMTPAEVAAAAKVSRSFVFGAIRRRELAATKLGKRLWRIDRGAYERWKAARTQQRAS